MTRTTVHSALQKGPFVIGSPVAISVLDALGDPTGVTFNTHTLTHLGEFSVKIPRTDDAALPLAIEGTGFYYNEATGARSGASISLRGIAELHKGESQNIYVNLITHLTFIRVKRLVESGMSYADAITQSERELRSALGIGPEGFDPQSAGADLSILGGMNLGNAYLFLVSAVIAEATRVKSAVQIDGGRFSDDGALQEILNRIESDLALKDGAIDPAITSVLDATERVLNPYRIEALFRERLNDLGAVAEVPSLAQVIDSDGDGIVNAQDNCPYTANLDQNATACEANIIKMANSCILIEGVGLRCRDSRSKIRDLKGFLETNTKSMDGDFIDFIFLSNGTQCFIRRLHAGDAAGPVECFDRNHVAVELTGLPADPIYRSMMPMGAPEGGVLAAGSYYGLCLTGNKPGTDNTRITCWRGGSGPSYNPSPYEAIFDFPAETSQEVPLILVGVAHNQFCALMSNQKIECFKNVSDAELQVVPDTPFSQVSVRMGTYLNTTFMQGCGVDQDTHLVRCWGGSSPLTSPPAEIFDRVFLGDFQACATRDDPLTTRCWPFFQSQGAKSTQYLPTDVHIVGMDLGLGDVSQIPWGKGCTLETRPNGLRAITCW